MKNPHLSTVDIMIFVASMCALTAATTMAMMYANNTNPDSVPFLLRPDTYGKVLPFLLGTVVAGGFALAYQRISQLREARTASRKADKALIDRRIKRLQELYDICLTLFQSIRLQRRWMRIALIPGESDGAWKLRREVFESICRSLNESQLSGEKIVKTLNFDSDALQSTIESADEQLIATKLQTDLKSQIGGLQGILRNVLKTAELQGSTKMACSPESLIDVPAGMIRFSESGSSGNLGFRKISEYHDAFSRQILARIRKLEAESALLGDV
jgi:hypothetical protein